MSEQHGPTRIGQLLIQRELISESDLKKALALQLEVGGLVGQLLVKTGSVSESDLIKTLSFQLNMPILPQDWKAPPPENVIEAAQALDVDVSWLERKNAVIWLEAETQTFNVASTNPLDLELRERIDSAVEWTSPASAGQAASACYLASRPQIEQVLDQLAPQDDDDLLDPASMSAQRLREMAEEAPVIEFVNRLFNQALEYGASDIHLEPFETYFEVRLRVDGILHAKGPYSSDRFRAIASRIKLLSNMDISESRLPQDGRQSIRVAGESVDLRVSTLPGSWGESLVLRLLRKEQTLPDLDGLGLTGRPAAIIRRSTELQNGIILVTGPTGSGKSTTLYRLLGEANTGTRKIVTVEDPVEYNIRGIVQVQTKADIGLNFASSLRSILRQDPDIIMVGEIRDGETASIAAQASLTGHLVYSTLHTNSALTSIDRLIDLGLERFLVASAVRIVAAQRLIRKLCGSCARTAPNEFADKVVQRAITNGMPAEAMSKLGTHWMQSTGCPDCSHTGFRGRLGAFEACEIDGDMQRAILDGTLGRGLVDVARRQGFTTMFEDGLQKASVGLTSLEEVLRVVSGMPTDETIDV